MRKDLQEGFGQERLLWITPWCLLYQLRIEMGWLPEHSGRGHIGTDDDYKAKVSS